MFFWNKVCGLLTLFFIFTASVCAQTRVTFASSYANFIQKNKAGTSDSISFAPPDHLNKSINFSTIPADFSTCNYGFFCKEELKIEKATGLPIRIRLGSLQQCNYYEGKR